MIITFLRQILKTKIIAHKKIHYIFEQGKVRPLELTLRVKIVNRFIMQIKQGRKNQKVNKKNKLYQMYLSFIRG